MKNVLIINGHQRYDQFAEGNLTKSMIDAADDFLSQKGYTVKHSIVQSAYDIGDELEKFTWADSFLFQYPVYWAGLPWLTKKYIDEVFSSGEKTVTYNDDGRSRFDVSKKYGSGGLMNDKKYMLSMTYNCPISEFDNKDGFWEGQSLDQVNIATHKTFKFCGANQLESFALHDIYKGDLQLEDEIKNFTNVLSKNFNKK